MKIREFKLRKPVLLLLMVPAIIFLAVSCDSSGKVRKYKEKSTPAPVETAQSPHGDMSTGTGTPPAGGQTMAASHGAKPHFTWDTPEGWEDAKKTSSFRLATFTTGDPGQTATCTIIPLAGDAGGVKANVGRWLGQVATGGGDDAMAMTLKPDEAKVKQIMDGAQKFLAKGNFPAIMFDFTPVTVKDDDASILAAVVTVDGSSIFFKMTGPKALLVKNRDKFTTLCKSLDFSSPEGTVQPGQ